MDPLSIASSVVGLLAAAGKIIEILKPVISTLKDSAKTATIIHSEVNSSRIILSALQVLFRDLDAAPCRRRDLIQIDQVIATLTDGVLLFSELEALVTRLGPATESLLTRIEWARKEKTLNILVARLQNFKGSISVILNILQW